MGLQDHRRSSLRPPQRRRRVILLASKICDPRPVLLGVDAGCPKTAPHGSHACGFYWTEGNTGIGWAIDAVPPLKGGSALHIPSPPAIWFLGADLSAFQPLRMQNAFGSAAGWTRVDGDDVRCERQRWRMIGNAVSVPLARWIAERLSNTVEKFDAEGAQPLPSGRGWPSAAWGHGGKQGRADVSESPVVVRSAHLISFLECRVAPLSKKATSGFHSRLIESSLRYEKAFERDLRYHMKNAERY